MRGDKPPIPHTSEYRGASLRTRGNFSFASRQYPEKNTQGRVYQSAHMSHLECGLTQRILIKFGIWNLILKLLDTFIYS
jgi:hypothetical protein